jgi:transcriptional regulator with XRE-family HTH domain
MARPTDVSRGQLAESIKALREHFGETQEEFARRLEVTIGSVARYETNAPPSARVLRKLKDLATASGQPRLQRMFGGFVESASDRDIALVMAMEKFVRTADETRFPGIMRLLRKELEQWGTALEQYKDRPAAIRMFLRQANTDAGEIPKEGMRKRAASRGRLNKSK